MNDPALASAQRVHDYAQAVIDGRIIAGPYVRNACRRHFDDLRNGEDRGFCWSPEAVHKVFQFFEKILVLSDGQFAGQPFRLQPVQCFILGSIFGWIKHDGSRRFRRAFIETGKGSGKTPLAGGLGLYGLVGDGEASAEIYAVASKKDQASILFKDACKMRRASPLLSDMIRQFGGDGAEINLSHHRSASFFRPMSREAGRSGSGFRPYFILADEIHEMQDRAILDMLEAGFKSRRSPLLFMITNSGVDRNSIAWEEHQHACNVATGSREAVLNPGYVGEVIDDTTFAYVCALDKGDDPLKDPSCWIKANPLLGVTITEEYLAEAVSQAKAMPGKLNTILRLHFCTWTDSAEAWMSRETIEPLFADFDPYEEHREKDVFCGLDLSQSSDLTALAGCTITGQTDKGKNIYDVWIEAWTPKDTVSARELRDKLPYQQWIRGKHLHAMPGRIIDYMDIAMHLIHWESVFSVRMVAYDRYAFRRVEDYVREKDSQLVFVEHPQGGKKRGAPLIEGDKESGLWFHESLREFEEAVIERRIRLKMNPVFVSAIMSAVVHEDTWGNRWLSKPKSINKIDPAVAAVMAVGAASKAQPVKKKRGLVLLTLG